MVGGPRSYTPRGIGMREVAAHHPLDDAPMALGDGQRVAVVGHLETSAFGEGVSKLVNFLG